MTEPLTKDTFDVWRESDNQFKDEMRGFITIQTALNLATEKRMSAVETKQEDTDATIKRRTAYIAALTGALVSIATAIGAWFKTS